MSFSLNRFNKRNKLIFVFSTSFWLSLLIALIYFFSPSTLFLRKPIQVSAKVVFLILIILFSYSAIRIFTYKVFQALLTSFFIFLTLVFFLSGLTNPFYFILLLVLFVILQFLFNTYKSTKL